ncbi:MAG: hypothetical protein AB7C91_02510 [Sphaerochaeta sp.]|uniref:hypothetical protein n=1 Tax=Sphaerochaeta sp. TaxID=1972642 RepID=UPI002FC9309A
MKKVLLALILVALVLIPVAAATEGTAQTDLAIGLNLGTSASISGQYRMDNFDIIANLGFGFLSDYLSVDGAANFKVAEFDIDKAHFNVTVGGGAYIGIPLSSGKGFGLAAIAPVGVVYNLENKDVPLDLYLRVVPGLWITPNIDFYYDAYIGAMWRFN